jgi:hypothetical protein
MEGRIRSTRSGGGTHCDAGDLLTFQLITDVEQFYVMVIYIPPNDSLGVDDLRAAL